MAHRRWGAGVLWVLLLLVATVVILVAIDGQTHIELRPYVPG